MTSKVDFDANVFPVVLNDNAQLLEQKNEYEVHDAENATAPGKIKLASGIQGFH